ncbi:hypothetical protein LY78DRAFT_705935 [Colletotrichum sublineola]|nr:hypothetical protein LY78DRAFT_705935 [Colletotrichum sublineola]
MDVETLIKNAPFRLFDENIRVLRGHSEKHEPHTWDEIKAIITAGEMGQLRRSPQDLRNYIMWHAEIRRTHSSMLGYVRRERLPWPNITACNDIPFGHTDDWKIIWNDWPERMTNLIESFLDGTFGETLGCRRGDDLLWFKQKTEWQSRVEKLVGQQRSRTLQALIARGMASTEPRVSAKMS